MRIPSIALSLAILPVLAASSLAATLSVGPGKPFETIGDAVAAASPGDTIVVSRNRYEESVTIDTPGLRLVGKSGAVWYPATFNQTSLVVESGADGVSVTGFSFRGRGTGILCRAGGLTVSKCTFRACNTAVEVQGGVAGAALFRCRSHLCGDAFVIEADDAILDRNTVAHTNSDCVVVEGARAVVTRNAIHGSGDDHAVEIVGDDARFEGNRVWSVWNCGLRLTGANGRVLGNDIRDVTSDDGIEVVGDGVLVQGNSVDGAYEDGIHVAGSGARILDNEVRGTGDDGIDVRGESFEVRGNSVRDASDPSGGIRVDNSPGAAPTPATVADNEVLDSNSAGFEVWGTGVIVEGNAARDSGGRGFTVYGSAHVLRRNEVLSCGWHGFDVQAPGTTLEDCSVRERGADGFRVGGAGTTLLRCEAFDAAADGIHSTTTGVSIQDCRFLENRRDVASPGSPIVDAGGNDFVTGGLNAASVD